MTDASPARNEHWDTVYRTRAAEHVSWHQPLPEPSLRAIDMLGVDTGAPLIDVGGGASRLVDCLLARGWSDLTVLDIAPAALEAAKLRLGEAVGRVRWIAADITAWRPEQTYAVWHDRAVFHFLTEQESRAAYRRALAAGLAPGGFAIMATFAPDGPQRCSGLPVQRYDAGLLSAELGPGFRLLRDWREQHVTPGGAVQTFNWCTFRRD